MKQLILNDGSATQLINNDYFLNAFRQASMSDHSRIAEALVAAFARFASPEELAQIEEIAQSAQAQYLEG